MAKVFDSLTSLYTTQYLCEVERVKEINQRRLQWVLVFQKNTCNLDDSSIAYLARLLKEMVNE